MKIQNKLPKSNENLHKALLDKGWVLIKEPQNMNMAAFLSIPFMIINALISIEVINIFSGISLEEFGFKEGTLTITVNWGIFIFLFFLVIFHEILHLILIPNFLKSEKTFIGLTWFGGFVVTEEEIVKSRYILITIAPFVIISIILPIMLGGLGLLTPILKMLILLNAVSSSVDILIFLLILKQVPNNVINKKQLKYGAI
ncbi:DUF3267 domain-containing protein [Bacillus sp. 1P10SD]|uniref:DUF3267 domain-containing protein n=1 Tax=Bacillus sp. 1P10SD TaxID=3132265 RepID=UPI0039A64E21